MDSILRLLTLLFLCCACTKQPSLPIDSKFNVTSLLSDAAWYGTAKAMRLYKEGQKPEESRRFDLLVTTDIDYAGNAGGPNPKTHNGCLHGDCIPTQHLYIHDIPLKKRRAKIAKLDKGKVSYVERTALAFRGNSGGLVKCYIYEKRHPGWVRVTGFDRKSGTVEGTFSFALDEDKNVAGRVVNGMPETIRFTNGLFRVKMTDVKLHE